MAVGDVITFVAPPSGVFADDVAILTVRSGGVMEHEAAMENEGGGDQEAPAEGETEMTEGEPAMDAAGAEAAEEEAATPGDAQAMAPQAAASEEPAAG